MPDFAQRCARMAAFVGEEAGKRMREGGGWGGSGCEKDGWGGRGGGRGEGGGGRRPKISKKDLFQKRVVRGPSVS
jgi:hypothetical protein